MTSETGSFVAPPERIREGLALNSAAEVVLIAAQCLRVGAPDYAAAICEAWPGPPDPAVSLALAAALFGKGERQRALALVEAVLAESPEQPSALYYRAQMALSLGDAAGAERGLLAVVERFPDFPGAQAALASLLMPGPSYRELLASLHQRLRPRAYLEIGVETGATLALAREAPLLFGVDPDRNAVRPELVPAHARLFHETSDAFFAARSARELMGEARLELAFIDGMHWFEFALRDFIALEAWSSPSGTIVLHDCLPLLPLTAARERRTKFWLGDVWKVVSCLAEARPDLRVTIVASAPSGLGIVRGLKPNSNVLRERYDELVTRYRDLAYPGGPRSVPSGFHVVPATRAGLEQALL